MKNRRFTPYLVLAGFTSALITTNLAFEDPVPVHADFGELGGAVDYIIALSDTEALSLGPGGGAVAGLILAVYMLANPSIGNNNTFEVDSISYMSGYYLDADGEIRIGCFTSAPSEQYRASGGFSVMYGYGIDLRCVYWDSTVVTSIANDDNNRIRYTISGGFSRLANVDDTSSGLLINPVANSNSKSFFGSYVSPLRLDSQLANFVGSDVISLSAYGSLPSGTLDCANPDAYIENVLRPYIEVHYPDYVYLLPEPPQPESQYATDDIVPGIPKDWTVINPELPTAPHFEINVPDADFSVLDVSETIAQYVIPIGFWFTLLDQTLDALHLKVILYVALAFGLLIYIVWKLGR